MSDIRIFGMRIVSAWKYNNVYALSMFNWNANEVKTKAYKIYIEKESIQALVWVVNHKHCFKRYGKTVLAWQIDLLSDRKIPVCIVTCFILVNTLSKCAKWPFIAPLIPKFTKTIMYKYNARPQVITTVLYYPTNFLMSGSYIRVYIGFNINSLNYFCKKPLRTYEVILKVEELCISERNPSIHVTIFKKKRYWTMKTCFELNDNLLYVIRRASFSNTMILIIHKNALKAVNY